MRARRTPASHRPRSTPSASRPGCAIASRRVVLPRTRRSCGDERPPASRSRVSRPAVARRSTRILSAASARSRRPARRLRRRCCPPSRRAEHRRRRPRRPPRPPRRRSPKRCRRCPKRRVGIRSTEAATIPTRSDVGPALFRRSLECIREHAPWRPHHRRNKYFSLHECTRGDTWAAPISLIARQRRRTKRRSRRPRRTLRPASPGTSQLYDSPASCAQKSSSASTPRPPCSRPLRYTFELRSGW